MSCLNSLTKKPLIILSKEEYVRLKEIEKKYNKLLKMLNI
jgi:hypothetical protein